MKNLSFLFIFILSISYLQAQTILWEKTFGGTDREFLNHTIQLADGSFMNVGYSKSSDNDVPENRGEEDGWVLKLDHNGEILSSKIYGGSAADELKKIIALNNGHFLIGGNATSTDGDCSSNYGLEDFWVLEIDANGNILWQKNYGGSDVDVLFDLKQVTNGFLLIGGSKSNDHDINGNYGNYDAWVVKIDSAGNILWQKNYGGSQKDKFYNMQITADGNYIFTGVSYSNDFDLSTNYGNGDMWIVKTDTDGNIIWQKTFGGSDTDWGTKTLEIPNNGFFVLGTTFSNDQDVSNNYGNCDVWLVKIDASGNKEWEKNMGSSQYDYAGNIIKNSNGNFVIIGDGNGSDHDVNTTHGQDDLWLFSIDNNANILWSERYGGNSYEFTTGILLETLDHNYLTGGITMSDNSGNVSANHGSVDAWLLKIGDNTQTIEQDNIANKIKIYPNPANNFVSIITSENIKQIILSDVSGQTILKQRQKTLSVENLAAGIYYMEIITDKRKFQQKLIVK